MHNFALVNCSTPNLDVRHKNLRSLSHTKWGCKYHVVWWMPKYRRKRLFWESRQEPWSVLQNWQRTKKARGWRVACGQTVCTSEIHSTEIRGIASGRHIKGQRAIHIAWIYLGRRRNFKGQHF